MLELELGLTSCLSIKVGVLGSKSGIGKVSSTIEFTSVSLIVVGRIASGSIANGLTNGTGGNSVCVIKKLSLVII